MSKQTVLITSATGRIGKELVARLAQKGQFNVRACYFSESKAEQLKTLGAHEVVKFDLSDPNTWGPALDGVSAIYSASLDPMLEGHLAFCKELGNRKADIKHVVRVSCMGADTNTASYDADTHASRAGAAIPLMLQHYWWGEKALLDEGLNVTVLRNNFFMNHLLKTDSESIDTEGWFSNPLGDMRNSFVATRDIAEAADVALSEGPEKHSNKFYDITGPQPQSMAEIAADLGRAMGKEIEYRAQSMVDFENDFGATRAEFFEYLTNGFYTRCSPDFYNLTGHKPTSYYDYLTTKGASGETGLEELWQGNLWKKGEDAMKDAANATK
ncbi:NAD(P)H-binding protein [Amylibacter sp. SFDW26]|uniref:SDR family oxidoreductase n=1 Tax=Amylibacter sp. SFDW26 TaxID=2652722 RepID=UPI00126186D3|nr:NAD(P)H-binding protein [Amylibacter sp. SFDW26]KAB7616324.1 NAD(P)H-binding protein [Amylibacter sp. SFDW26]